MRPGKSEMTICLSSRIVNASEELSAPLHHAASGYRGRPGMSAIGTRPDLHCFFYVALDYVLLACKLRLKYNVLTGNRPCLRSFGMS
jgi:hypothetical protein